MAGSLRASCYIFGVVCCCLPAWNTAGLAQAFVLPRSGISRGPKHAARSVSNSGEYRGDGFRVVRCLPSFSRRDADRVVASGRVSVNGLVVAPSYRLKAGDEVALDGKKVEWKVRAAAEGAAGGGGVFAYFKYHKPVGVTCTMDPNDRSGLLRALKGAKPLRKLGHGKVGRLFPVGRLDKDSQGLVLLTDDGRIADLLTQPHFKREKEYLVETTPRLTSAQCDELARGVEITTTQQRSGATITSRTAPCVVERHGGTRDRASIRFVLLEGRNRQIRKMVEAVSGGRCQVSKLLRVRHCELTLGTLPEGGVAEITGGELERLVASSKWAETARQAGKKSASRSRNAYENKTPKRKASDGGKGKGSRGAAN